MVAWTHPCPHSSSRCREGLGSAVRPTGHSLCFCHVLALRFWSWQQTDRTLSCAPAPSHSTQGWTPREPLQKLRSPPPPPHISERSRATIVATQTKGVSSVHAEKSQIRCTSDACPHWETHTCKLETLVTVFACQMITLECVVLGGLSAVTGVEQPLSCLPGSCLRRRNSWRSCDQSETVNHFTRCPLSVLPHLNLFPLLHKCWGS